MSVLPYLPQDDDQAALDALGDQRDDPAGALLLTGYNKELGQEVRNRPGRQGCRRHESDTGEWKETRGETDQPAAWSCSQTVGSTPGDGMAELPH